MSKRKGCTEIRIPTKDFEELTVAVKKLGFKSLDEFAEEATREYLEKERREAEAK